MNRSHAWQRAQDHREEGRKRRGKAHRPCNGAAGASKTGAQVPASRKRASTKGTGGNSGNGEAAPGKGDGASAQALVRDPQHEGEVVRKSRAVDGAGSRCRSRSPGSSPKSRVPTYWDKACADLVKRDRILKKLIPKFGPVHLLNRDDPFATLARSVVGQQISVRAAQTIWERVEAACPKLAPQQFIKLGHEKLRRADSPSASRNTFSILRSISYRARCTSTTGRRWKTKR